MLPQDHKSERFVSALTKSTVALILAGGRGTRLKDLTQWRAKPALPFGGKFRIIDFPLSNCINSGIRRVGVLTQYKAHSLIQHIQRGWSFMHGEFNEFVEVLPAQQRIEEQWYKGTADAVFQNIDILRSHNPEFVIILAGDHIYKMDYGKMLAGHVRCQADMSIACLTVPLADATAFGVMSVNSTNRVVGFQEKLKEPTPMPSHPDKALASMGIYVFNTHFLYEQLLRDAHDQHSSHDFGHDIIPYLISNYRVYAHHFDDSCVGNDGTTCYWRDVGTIDAYWDANMEMTKVTPELNQYDKVWPIWTYQEQWPPAKFVFDDECRRGSAVDSIISDGVIVSGASVCRSVLFFDVHVNSYSTVEDSVIFPNVRIGERVFLKRVIVDRGCVIPDGMEVGLNPDNDRKRFHVSEKSGVTLITPDMLGQSRYPT
ncbi:MAG: glucose-1-phosphate adenylyltransferase [Betaproteobacteria bacterium]|nr:glucose-1-phosphate adenylyltransferase [Betaproteobacteria bacterium]